VIQIKAGVFVDGNVGVSLARRKADMPRNSVVTAALLALLVPFFGPLGKAQALQAAKLPILQANLVQPVGFNRCHAWSDKCAWRWGLGTWRFARRLRRHGC
jgi:hypothetical protein